MYTRKHFLDLSLHGIGMTMSMVKLIYPTIHLLNSPTDYPRLDLRKSAEVFVDACPDSGGGYKGTAYKGGAWRFVEVWAVQEAGSSRPDAVAWVMSL